MRNVCAKSTKKINQKFNARSDELKITPNAYIEETMSEEGFSEALQNLKRESRERRKALSIRPYPRILFLGTGSCIPNKTRNTSGILLQIR